MLKRLYHGSEYKIENPTYGVGKKYNDYGQGFYCTEAEEMAMEWAVSLGRNGYANVYDLDMSELKVLNLNSNEYCILHWLSILLQNREFEINSVLAREAREYIVGRFTPAYKTADIIIGYRADDSYFSFAEDFLNGTISYRQLSRAMKLGKLGEQIVIKSEKAFAKISYIESKVVLASDWYAKRQYRDRSARDEYFNLERNRREKGDIYITNILDEEMTEEDVRLR